MVEELQAHFAETLTSLGASFSEAQWLRDEGRHGGGHRYFSEGSALFNRAAINVSGVHYDNSPQKQLSSADALSTIIHPAHPLLPSVHIHLSFTEMRNGNGYHRMMADLNPAIETPDDTRLFESALREAAPSHFEEAQKQGNQYFYIPELRRHRGVSHFYLEGFTSGDFAADTKLVEVFGRAAIDGYTELLRAGIPKTSAPTKEERRRQLAYHTLYLFQVLTLDRGTTSGLLVHTQNDLGIMGSLPSFVDRDLLASWVTISRKEKRPLVEALVQCLPKGQPSAVNNETRLRLAACVREFYTNNPDALQWQARGKSVPATVNNHA